MGAGIRKSNKVLNVEVGVRMFQVIDEEGNVVDFKIVLVHQWEDMQFFETVLVI